MPRKTALPCSTRPRTRPALVDTTGSAEPIGATSRYVSGALTVMIFNDFRSFNRIEHHRLDLARRRLRGAPRYGAAEAHRPVVSSGARDSVIPLSLGMEREVTTQC